MPSRQKRSASASTPSSGSCTSMASASLMVPSTPASPPKTPLAGPARVSSAAQPRSENVASTCAGAAEHGLAIVPIRPRNRQARPRECFGRSVLTEAMALDALWRVKNGESQASVARDFGMSRQVINYIATGKTWRYLRHRKRPANQVEKP